MNNYGTPDEQAQEDEHARELIELLNLLETVDRRITPEHVTRRFGEFLDDIGDAGQADLTDLDATIEVIAAARGAAADIIADARQQAQAARDELQQAQDAVAAYRQEAEQIVAAAQREKDEALRKAAKMVQDAEERAKRIITDARREAAQILRAAQEKQLAKMPSLQLQHVGGGGGAHTAPGAHGLLAADASGDPAEQRSDAPPDLAHSSSDVVPELADLGRPWPKVTVVIPTRNEARNLPHVFAKLPQGLHEVIIVDGNSVDDTVATARMLRPDVRIITQNRSGKGNALACGFAAATGDIVATVDGDGSADPGEIPQFIQALLDGADYAKGSRFAHGGGSCDITRLRRLGSWVLSTLVNVLCRTKYSDLCYGYNVFWRQHVPVFGLDVQQDIPVGSGTRLWGDGFEVDTLISIRIAQAGLNVKEVASYEHSRIHGVSNLNAVRDGWRVLRTIIAERYYYHHRQRKVHGEPASPGTPLRGQQPALSESVSSRRNK